MTFIYYNPETNCLFTYFYSEEYKMFLTNEQIAPDSLITITQLSGRSSFEARKERERDKWVYIGQL